MIRPLTAAGLVLVFAPLAVAQPVPPGGGPQRPSYGSYLGLLSGGGSPGINYLGVVRPQQQLRQGVAQNQQQLQQSNSLFQQEFNGLAVGADPSLPFTGRVARFNSVAPYYTRNPVTGLTGRVAGGFGSVGGTGGVGGFNTLGNRGGIGNPGGFGNQAGLGARSPAGGAAAPRAGGVRR